LEVRDWPAAADHFARSGAFVVNFRPDLLPWAELHAGAAVGAPAQDSLGALLLSENLPELAEEAFARARAIHPRDPIALFLGASTAARRLAFDDALVLLDQLAGLEPAYWPARYAMGEIWLSKRDPKRAFDAYLRVLEADPDNERARERLDALSKAADAEPDRKMPSGGS
jgi:tetratricopeptide (TPR) repeat protein